MFHCRPSWAQHYLCTKHVEAGITAPSAGSITGGQGPKQIVLPSMVRIASNLVPNHGTSLKGEVSYGSQIDGSSRRIRPIQIKRTTNTRWSLNGPHELQYGSFAYSGTHLAQGFMLTESGNSCSRVAFLRATSANTMDRMDVVP